MNANKGSSIKSSDNTEAYTEKKNAANGLQSHEMDALDMRDTVLLLPYVHSWHIVALHEAPHTGKRSSRLRIEPSYDLL